MNEATYIKKKDENKREFYEFSFLGHKKHCYCSEEHIKEKKRKRDEAYRIIPVGATIIPQHLISLCTGWFIGGILEDSLYPVYGICQESGRGIPGYSCSVYWLPTQEEINKILPDETKLHGEFFKKET